MSYSFVRLWVAMLVFVPAATASGERPSLEALKSAALEMVQSRAKLTQEIVDSVFSFAELGYQEFETSAYLAALLRREGFRVSHCIAGIPTAFVAEWGSGSPIVGLMADIDALPGTSQKPGVAYHAPLITGGPGHGEGHNAGAAVNVTAAVVVKRLMQGYAVPGTIRLYPGVAEELVGSRSYMVMAGLFRGLDAMLSAHISSEFSSGYGSCGSGMISTQYTFHGRGAHATAAWAGASALDAAELMNVGWNYRREHLRPEHLSHYVIVHGGEQPNIVPTTATVWYYFRELDYERIRRLHETGTRIANAAAQMTDTVVSERVLAATWPGYFNKPLAEALMANVRRVGMPEWSEADRALTLAAQNNLKSTVRGLRTDVGELKRLSERQDMRGSDDIAEVSWNLPTAVLWYPGNIPGMMMHHWSGGIAMATPISHKGATAGAKAQALTVLDLLLDPSLLPSARSYFNEQTRDIKWKSLVPEGTMPPIDLNRNTMDCYRGKLRALRFDPTRYKTYMEQLGIKYPSVR